MAGAFTTEKLPTYQRESDHYIIKAKAACDLDTRIVSESDYYKNENYEDDVDNGEGRSSSDWVHEIRLWPGRDDFFRWMHSERSYYQK